MISNDLLGIRAVPLYFLLGRFAPSQKLGEKPQEWIPALQDDRHDFAAVRIRVTRVRIFVGRFILLAVQSRVRPHELLTEYR